MGPREADQPVRDGDPAACRRVRPGGQPAELRLGVPSVRGSGAQPVTLETAARGAVLVLEEKSRGAGGQFHLLLCSSALLRLCSSAIRFFPRKMPAKTAAVAANANH